MRKQVELFNRSQYRAAGSASVTLAFTAFYLCSAGQVFAQSDKTEEKPEKADSTKAKDRFETPFAAFRFGLAVSPDLGAQVGLDFTFPRLSLGRSWVTRFDVEAQALLTSPSFGSRRDSMFSFNLCQIYSPGGTNRSKFYAGGGIGVAYGPFSGTVGGKLFLGTNVSQTVAFELQTLFPGGNSPQIVLGIRLSNF